MTTWSARLFRIELRRNATWALLPLLAALMWVASPYGRALRAPVVLWSSRSLALQGTLQVLGPFAAGIAAWMASREARRRMTDLVTSTPRGVFSRRLAALSAAACWAMILYVAAGALLFALTAREATWGGPVWWPIAVGAVGVLAFTAFGFACGVVWPGRFTAPLLAAGLMLLLQLGLASKSVVSWVSPVRVSVSDGATVFFGVDPGLALTQIIFLAGVVIAALGVIAVPRRRGPIAVAVAGILVAGAGVGLAATGRQQAPVGPTVPSLSSAASARPVSYTPVCDDGAPVPVCVHPAFRSLLPAMAADLAPVTSQVAGLPGAPVRIETAAPGDPGAGVTTVVSGRPPVLYLGQFANLEGPMTAAELAQSLQDQAARAITGLVTIEELNGARLAKSQSAQLDVALGLGLVAGDRLPPAAPIAILEAARRFAGLPESVRHVWLAAHLTALRAGHITPEELP